MDLESVKLTRTISIIAQADGKVITTSSNKDYKALARMLDERFTALEEATKEASVDLDDISANKSKQRIKACCPLMLFIYIYI